MCQVFICGVQSEIKGVRQKIWARTKVPNLMTHVGRGDFHTLNTIIFMWQTNPKYTIRNKSK